MNIYFIPCKEQYPVGQAGAVIVAGNSEEATSLLPRGCIRDGDPVLIGVAAEEYKAPCVVFFNSTDY